MPLPLTNPLIPFSTPHKLRNQLLNSPQPLTYITISALARVANGVACIFASRLFAAFDAIFAGESAVAFCSFIVSLDFYFDEEKGGGLLSYTALLAGGWSTVAFIVSVYDLVVFGVHGASIMQAENSLYL